MSTPQPYRLSQPADVLNLLHSAPAFQRLDRPTQAELSESLGKVAAYLGDGQPLAEKLAPADLRSRLSPPAPAAGSPAPIPADGSAPAPAAGGGQPTATMRAGTVARATLNAIDFPQFVASLIQGTFQAIVDASIQQMEAYAELIKNVALTVDQFMQDNVNDGMARDYLADRYGSVFTRDTNTAQPVLRVRDDAGEEPLPTFFQGLGFETPNDIDEEAIDQVIVPETRRTMAEQRQQMLATMVLMGINRVVVDDGEIDAKLQFHVDASETMRLKFDQTKTTVGNMAGTAGRNTFAGNGIMVNTTNLNAQSDLNVRADLTGQVKVRFRSETFPLQRFADSAAIQLINSRATVPTAPAPAAAPAPATPAAGESAGPAAPPPLPPPAPAAQALAAFDPWVPQGTV